MHPDCTDFEDTHPAIARWDCDISGEGLWTWRCARRMLQLRLELDLDQAYDLAQALSRDHRLRARLPEQVAEDRVREAWRDR